MNSIRRAEITTWAQEVDKTISATDPRFYNEVIVIHEDGSIFRIKNSFIIPKDEYIVVFSEHFDLLLFSKNDLYSVDQLKLTES